MLLPVASAEGSELARDGVRLLVESVQDYAIFMLDLDGRVATWNRGAERIKGYSAGEIVGRHFSVFYPEEDVAAGTPTKVLESAIRDGRVEYEGWRVRKDGSRFWANVIVTALHDASGRLRGFGKVTRDLTERRAAAEALRGSEERFRLLVEGISDYAVYMLDVGGNVSTWNRGAEAIKGYVAAEIVGRHYSAFFLPEDVAAGRPEIQLAIARAEGRYEEEGWRRRKDGTRFRAAIVLTPIRDLSGELVGFAKVTRDLTTSQQAEETARELVRERTARSAAEEAEGHVRVERERYRALSRRLEVILESIGDGIIVQERSTEIIFANSEAARMCGYASGKQLLGSSFADAVARLDLFDQDGRPFDRADLPARRLLRGESPPIEPVTLRVRRGDDEWWASVRAATVLAEDGETELAVSIWHDASAERRREEHERYLARVTATLSSSSLDLDATLRSFADVLVPGLADWCSIHVLEEGRLQNVAVSHVDPARLAGAIAYESKYPPDPAQDRGVWRVLRTGEPELLHEISDELLQLEARDEEQLGLLRAAGLRSVVIVPIRVRDRVSGTLTLLSSESGKRYDRSDLALFEELGRRAGITIENARLYAAERRARERVEHAAEVAAKAARAAEEASRVKDEFLATVSHELRTPLNAILGWSTLLRDSDSAAAVAKGIAVIHRNARAQSKIIEDILDVSRIITGKLRLDLGPADLVAVLGDAVEVVRPSAIAKGLSIVLQPPAKPCVLVADAERLQQVVWNVLSNAVKFTDPGGTIAIAIEHGATQLCLRVTDTGRGIDPAFLPYVFDRFKQADASSTRRVGGLGLGLALVRHIVELHGGAVEAASAGLGKGATFSITLPLRPAVTAAREPEAPSSRSARRRARPKTSSLGGLRVLVVDDEPDARELLQVLLEGAGALVALAASSAEAFELVQRFRPDVLLSDVAMPDEDGYGLMRRVRALSPELGGGIPSIALTAYTRADDRATALAVGFTTHLGKPVGPEELVATIARLARPAAS